MPGRWARCRSGGTLAARAGQLPDRGPPRDLTSSPTVPCGRAPGGRMSVRATGPGAVRDHGLGGEPLAPFLGAVLLAVPQHAVLGDEEALGWSDQREAVTL